MADDYAKLLEELGFGIVRSSLPMAVREFQGYASLERAARVATPTTATYSDRLESVELTPALRFSGAPDGIIDSTTGDLIRAWAAAKLRCPVVIEAWTMGGKETCNSPRERRALVNQNAWLANDFDNEYWRAFGMDFSGRFYPLTASGAPERVPVGKYTHEATKDEKTKKETVFKGIKTKAPWQTRVELLPATVGLAGFPDPGTVPSEPPSDSDRIASTYRVVRAVYERECSGYLDALNAYDKGVISSGAFHYTFASGELAAYLAFQLEHEPTLSRFFVPWGLRPGKDWGANGTALFQSGQRKYECEWTRPGKPDPLPPPLGDFELYRTWHWLFRFQALARAVGVAATDYEFARLRLLNVLATPFQIDDPVPKRKDGSVASLGDIFRSELAAAYLLRWHVNLPGHVVEAGHVSPRVVGSVKKAKLDLNKTADLLTDSDESSLLNRLMAAAPPAIATDFSRIRLFPSAGNCWKLLHLWGDDNFGAAKAFLKLGVARKPGFLLHSNQPAPPSWES